MASWTWWRERRGLDDGRVLYAYRSIDGLGLLGVAASKGSKQFVEVWCYPNVAAAIAAVRAWSGSGRAPKPGRMLWRKARRLDRRRIPG